MAVGKKASEAGCMLCGVPMQIASPGCEGEKKTMQVNMDTVLRFRKLQLEKELEAACHHSALESSPMHFAPLGGLKDALPVQDNAILMMD